MGNLTTVCILDRYGSKLDISNSSRLEMITRTNFIAARADVQGVHGPGGNPFGNNKGIEFQGVSIEPGCSLHQIITILKSEKIQEVLLPNFLLQRSTKNHQGKSVCLYVCLYVSISFFAIYSKNLQATHTSKFVILCNIFLRMPL